MDDTHSDPKYLRSTDKLQLLIRLISKGHLLARGNCSVSLGKCKLVLAPGIFHLLRPLVQILVLQLVTTITGKAERQQL